MEASHRSRVPIPGEIAAEVEYRSDRTCCVCNIPGKPYQIHHIDDDRSNNVSTNLCVLCLECHNDTQVKGGFARKLNDHNVRKFRSSWHERVESRRAEADRVASLQAVRNHGEPTSATGVLRTRYLPEQDASSHSEELKEQSTEAPGSPTTMGHAHSATPEDPDSYILALPDVKRLGYVRAREGFGGSTADVLNAASELMAIYETILTTLSTWAHKANFSEETPETFFSELVSSRFRWHRLRYEFAGWAGTINGPIVAGEVLRDVDEMVVELVEAMVKKKVASVDYRAWLEIWNNSDESH